jgi:hypothetical protein
MAGEFARIRMVSGGNEVDVAAMCDGKVPRSGRASTWAMLWRGSATL